MSLPDLRPFRPDYDSTDDVLKWFDAEEPLPRGTFFIKNNPLPCVADTLVGNQMGDQVRGDSAWETRDATILIKAGDQSKPLLKINRPCFTTSQITLQGKPMWKSDSPIGTGPVIEVTQEGNADPVGNITFDRTSILASEMGWYFAPGSHADHIRQIGCLAHKVNYPYVINENQSVEHHLDLTLKGNGKYAVWAKDGGRVRGHVETNGYWDRFLVVGDETQGTFPTKNNGSYNLSVLFDGGDKFGSLYEERYKYTWSQPVVKINGFMAADVQIAQPPIMLNRSDIQIQIDKCFGVPYIFNSPLHLERKQAILNMGKSSS